MAVNRVCSNDGVQGTFRLLETNHQSRKNFPGSRSPCVEEPASKPCRLKGLKVSSAWQLEVNTIPGQLLLSAVVFVS